MVRSRSLDRKHPTNGSPREALLAATTIQLLPGDLLSANPGDAVAGQFAPAAKNKRAEDSLVGPPALESRLTVCAATARGLQAAGSESLVLAFSHAGALEHGWMSALEWAQTARLPLIWVCSDATNGALSTARKTGDPAIDFTSMSRFSKRHKLPVLTVDGEDAVAVYRVMQESALRARQGGGPSVIWAVMTPKRSVPTMPASSLPIARLRRYLAARKIAIHP